MEHFQTIIISVFSGVLTALCVYIASLFIKEVLIPRYQKSVYRGIDVSGDWEGKHDLGYVGFELKLHLIQNAHDLQGRATFIKYSSDNDVIKVTDMRVEGEVWEGFVSLKCRTVSNKNLSFGSMLCKVGDHSLQGKYIFRNLAGDSSSITDVEVSLHRAEA
ncbi:hypothetical protein ACU440_004532 [Vibrio alginolyticus]|uniref:hypothetical protein n=1 Tax=unclassified Vibrio TaxID=2614977 RepID=UPI001482009C|nr:MULTISPECIES: hypothetical protein [unclassified Vibrio]EGQ9177313.1 hypothetical protein [Vibrio alginolyticus]MDE0544972.1 hypothetical protein [Vibrio sp. VA3]MDW1802704.1 hypothetical protein [Vibrio sp. Vb2201]NNN51204.1 hypothetical protein [Vibrio sp. 2-2(7)]NNN86670.1 hypothetical protein [Vibrio sp. 2-2(9)]